MDAGAIFIDQGYEKLCDGDRSLSRTIHGRQPKMIFRGFMNFSVCV